MNLSVSHEKTAVSRLHDAIVQMINKRGMQVGDKFPSEERLTEDFKVSRQTVREAFKLLEQDGVIRVEHGRGRFLMAGAALYIERPITTFESATAMAAGLGYKTNTSLLSLNTVEADEEISAGLSCQAGTQVLRIERLRFNKKRPILYSLDIVRKEDLTEGSDLEGSIVELLRKRGQAPVASTAKVSATFLPPEAVEQHRLQDFGPALLITETCFTAQGYPVLFARDFHHSKYFTFSFVRR